MNLVEQIKLSVQYYITGEEPSSGATY